MEVQAIPMSERHEIFYHSEENFLIAARQIFAPERLRSLREKIQQKREAMDDPEERADQFGVASNEVRVDPQWFFIWEEADREVLQRYVPTYTQITFPPMIRTVSSYQAFVPWHQDQAYVRAMGSRGHGKIITCFVPLDEDPRARPTLEFSLDPRQQPIEHIKRHDQYINQFDLEEKDKPAPGQTLHFDLNLGDALFFGQWVLHRTFFPQTTFTPRHSMEFRLTTAECRIAGKDYYDVSEKRFYPFSTEE